MTAISRTGPPGTAPGRNVNKQSVVFASHSFTVPSDEAVRTWLPSLLYVAPLTYDVWPRNSFKVFPLLRPWMRAVWSGRD